MSEYTSTYMQMLNESTRASSRESQTISFDRIKPGMIAEDYAQTKSTVIAKGTWKDVRRYDSSGAMNEAIGGGYVSADDNMLAVEMDDGDTVVYVHGGDGAEVYVKDNRLKHLRPMSEHHGDEADAAGGEEVPGFSEELLAVPVGKVLDLLNSRVAANEEDEELKSLYEKLEAFLTEASEELVPNAEKIAPAEDDISTDESPDESIDQNLEVDSGEEVVKEGGNEDFVTYAAEVKSAMELPSDERNKALQELGITSIAQARRILAHPPKMPRSNFDVTD